MSLLGASEEKRKTVLKQVLEDPYLKTTWPEVPEEKITTITSLLVSVLAPVRHYHEAEERSRASGTKMPPTPAAVNDSCLGFNSVTKGLQAQAKHNLAALSGLSSKSTETKEPITMVFICRDDIMPDILTKHFPTLCASASDAKTTVYLVALPSGSMAKLSDATGRRDLGYVALRSHRDFDTLHRIVAASVSGVSLPWKSDCPFTPLQVKNLATTAPIKKSKNQANVEKTKAGNDKAKVVKP